MIDFKKLVQKEAEKAILKKAVGKILPMEDAKPKLGKKAKLAGVLAAVIALLTALSNYLAG